MQPDPEKYRLKRRPLSSNGAEVSTRLVVLCVIAVKNKMFDTFSVFVKDLEKHAVSGGSPL